MDRYTETEEETQIAREEYGADIEGWYEHFLDTVDRLDQPYRSYIQGAVFLTSSPGMLIEGFQNAIDGEGFLPYPSDTESRDSNAYWSLGQKAATRHYDEEGGSLSFLAGIGTMIGVSAVTGGAGLVSLPASVLGLFDLANSKNDRGVEEVDKMLEHKNTEEKK